MTASPDAAIAFFRNMFDRRSADELQTIARIKRLRERFMADKGLRDKIEANLDDPSKIFKEYGFDGDAEALRPIWDLKFAIEKGDEAAYADYPEAQIWKSWFTDLLAHRRMLFELGEMAEINPPFHAWRNRHILRNNSDLGKRNESITYPIIAYELCDGCSVGCWFCGISAEKFKGHAPYTEENATLWRGMLKVMVDLFGTAAQTGFCYWATDPMDNPDYPKYAEDHYHITGLFPQMTTAAPLKDVALTREVLALGEKYRCVINRFSILTLKILERVHAEFSADELLAVELVIQGKGSILGKAIAGRAMDHKDRISGDSGDTKVAVAEHGLGTVACVSGFLVNLPHRTVKLVTPCRASKRWPKGYRVYEEARFSTAQEYREVLEGMIARHMPESLPADTPLAFRSDLKFVPGDGFFELKGEVTTHKVKGLSCLGTAAPLIAGGDKTPGDIIARLTEEGTDIFSVTQVLQDLFNLGFIEDDPVVLGRTLSAENTHV